MSTITTTIFTLDPLKSVQQIVTESFPGSDISLYDVIATNNTFTLIVKSAQLNATSFAQTLNAHIADIDVNWSELAYSISAQSPMTAGQYIYVNSNFLENTVFDYINIENVLQIEAKLVFSNATTAEVVVNVYTAVTQQPFAVSIWRLENIAITAAAALNNSSTAAQSLSSAPAISAKVTKLI
jgi:hypothetical protein